MKRTFVTLLVLVFVLSIAGTAMAAAANPFVDVPAKHWAYDAINKLAKAGIIDGMGDGTFQGDKTMTRYEMAQIVAKAMARSDKADAANKALIDKLAVEFAKELNNLGVRVAKLEAKTNIGLNYESMIRYSDYQLSVGGLSVHPVNGTNRFDMRQRIYFSGAVNDNVTYGARIEAGKVFGGGSMATAFNQAYFNVKDFMGAFDQLTIGKFSTVGITNGLLNGRESNDGFSITKKLGSDTTFTMTLTDTSRNAEVVLYNIDYKMSETVKFNLGYQRGNFEATSVWPTVNGPLTFGVPWKINSLDFGTQIKMGDFFVTGEFVRTKEDYFRRTWKGYAIQITNGKTGYFYPAYNLVDPKKAHTDAFAISYRKLEYVAAPTTSVFNSSAPISFFATDLDNKGYFFTYQNVISKNVVWTVEYQELTSGVMYPSSYKEKCWNTSVQFFF